ncbi:MAG: hypothetical protein ACOY4K_08650 [Pseudomonadota bacterium]
MMDELERFIRLGTDDEKLDALYSLSGLQVLPSWLSSAPAEELLLHDDPNIRERAAFVFGIKLKRTDLCHAFEAILTSTPAHNLATLSVAALAMLATGCRPSENVLDQLIVLLKTPDVNAKIGSIIYALLLHHLDYLTANTLRDLLTQDGPISDYEIQRVEMLTKSRA